MERLIEVTPEQWLLAYNQGSISGRLSTANVHDNLFASLQWTGRDSIQKTQRRYWALQTEHGCVSFLQSYYLSHNRIRLRGLCTQLEFRRRGYMKTLLHLVVEELNSSQAQIICFASKMGLPVCEAVGFKKVENFTPRYVEFKNSLTQTWEEDQSSPLYMLSLSTSS